MIYFGQILKAKEPEPHKNLKHRNYVLDLNILDNLLMSMTCPHEGTQSVYEYNRKNSQNATITMNCLLHCQLRY
jgi:hypothetical protein